MPFNNPPGFRITSFERDSIFGQMGLRNQDLVLSVNGEEFQGSEQAASFLQKIRDGGDLDIKVRRRARNYHIHLKIE